MQKNDRFGKEWSGASTTQEYPSDSQAQQGLAFLGATPPSYNLHDAMFQALDWKDNWLYDQIKAVLDANGITPDLSVNGDRTALAQALTQALLNQQVASTTKQGIVELATITEARAGTDSKTALTPAGGMAQLDDRIADQDTVDAGEDDSKFITALKLKNWIKQASESVLGLLKVATQTQVDAGSEDTVAVTPKKLRWGVSYSLGSNGYIALPSWLGGVIFQWVVVSITDGIGTNNWPLAFPNSVFRVISSESTSQAWSGTQLTVTGPDMQMTTNSKIVARSFRWNGSNFAGASNSGTVCFGIGR